MDLSSLLDLCRLHSTPGDEDEVASFLLRCWRQHGLTPEVYGRYAVAARIPGASSAPTVLICAHMDSPGYVVQRVLRDRRRAVAVALASRTWDDDEQPTQAAIVKQRPAASVRLEPVASRKAGGGGDRGLTLPAVTAFAFHPRLKSAAASAGEFPRQSNRCFLLTHLAGRCRTRL